MTAGSHIRAARPRRAGLYLLAALGIAFAGYGSSLGGEFVYDDIPILVGSDCHRDLTRVPELFLPWRGDICGHRPVRYASFALDYALWGDWSPGYHLSNVLLHGLVIWLAFLLLLRVLHGSGLPPEEDSESAPSWPLPAAAVGAALFALHPVTTEAVAYVSGRRDLLMALFGLLATHAYLGFIQVGGWWRVALMLLALLCGMLSHELEVALPAALVAFELCRAWPHGRGGLAGLRAALRRLIAPRRGLALGAALVAAGGYALWMLAGHSHSTRVELWGPTVGAHVATVLRVHLHYLRLLLVPNELLADYSAEAFPASQSLLDPAAVAAALVLGAVLAAAAWLLPRRPLVSGAVLAYFVLLLPVSHIVVHHELLAEHRLYLPALCYAGVAGGGLVWLSRRWRRVGWALVAAVLAVYALRTNLRNLDWRTSLDLWRATVEAAPRSARGHANLGATLASAGRFDSAERHLELALSLQPELCSAQLNYGQLLMDTGRDAEGLKWLRRSVRCHPAPRYFRVLGYGALQLQRYRLAQEAFRAGLDRNPQDARLRFGLGMSLHRLGQPGAAIPHYRRAGRTRSRWPKLRYRLTRALAETCRLEEAARELARFRAIVRREEGVRRLERAVRANRTRCRGPASGSGESR